MELRTNTIQYRMVNLLFRNPSINLCVYFWQCVVSWGVAALALLTASSVLFVGHALMTGGTSIEASIWLIAFTVPGAMAWVFIMAGVVIAIMFGAIQLIDFVRDGIKIIFGRNVRKQRSPSVVGEYIKAKKEKLCPRITFVDNSNPSDEPTNPPKRK